MIDYQYIFAMIKIFSVKYSGTPRSWQQIVCIVGGQSCLRCGLWMDGIEKQTTWKKTWKTWRKKLKKTWKDPGNRLFALCEGQSCLRCGYLDMSDIPPICWLGSCIMLENGWNLKKQIETRKMTPTLQSSKACRTFNFSFAHMLLFIFTIKYL